MRHAAGYVLLIEDYANKSTASAIVYAPVTFESCRFAAGQMSLKMYVKEFLPMHFAFDKLRHVLWGVKKSIIVMMDNKALTRFFSGYTESSEIVEFL